MSTRDKTTSVATRVYLATAGGTGDLTDLGSLEQGGFAPGSGHAPQDLIARLERSWEQALG